MISTDFSIGDLVSLQSKLPYLKTVDTMPMLRPADLVSIGEVGEIVGIRAMNIAEVKFRRGRFLISMDKLSKDTNII